MAGTKFYLHGFDKGRGVRQIPGLGKPPATHRPVSFTAAFFKDADGKLKLRTQNARDVSDPPRIYPWR